MHATCEETKTSKFQTRVMSEDYINLLFSVYQFVIFKPHLPSAVGKVETVDDVVVVVVAFVLFETEVRCTFSKIIQICCVSLYFSEVTQLTGQSNGRAANSVLLLATKSS